jgi:hypothetical protein
VEVEKKREKEVAASVLESRAKTSLQGNKNKTKKGKQKGKKYATKAVQRMQQKCIS